MAAKTTKFFVLDTNVILHDSACLHQFKQHDVVLPITVLEELDKFKKGNETLNFHARHFLKEIDKISEDGVFNGGLPIGKNRGLLIIKLDQKFHPDLKNHFDTGTPDHHILNCAYCLSKENPGREVTLVTKDVNLRMKAKAVHLIAEDYTTDHVKDISTIYKGYRFEENVSRELIHKLCHDDKGIALKSFKSRTKFNPRTYRLSVMLTLLT
jgi:PhoH-like ATPase